MKPTNLNTRDAKRVVWLAKQIPEILGESRAGLASVWQFASTRGLIFLADAQSAVPEELQVLEIFLPTKLVARASSPIITPRYTGDSLKMTPSPCSRYAQQSNIWSHIPVHASQPRPGRTTLVWPELGPGLSWGIALGFVAADVLDGDISNLVNLDQVGLVVALPRFTLVVILLERFMCFQCLLFL